MPYGKRVKLSSEVSHTRCFRFVVIYVINKLNTGRSAHDEEKKRKGMKRESLLILNVIRDTLRLEGCGL